MATAAAAFRKLDDADSRTPQRDEFRLRPLPHEDVFFYCKKIDNSRLVREADPAARNTCWKAIGAATLSLAFLTGVAFPNVAGTIAGYRLQTLQKERDNLGEERRVLNLQEAALLSPERLQVLAQQENLVKPAPAQIVHLNRPDGSVAMVKSK